MRWVGGAAPSRGGSWRSDEDASLLARMASVAGFQKRTTSAGTPPAQYSPLLVPLPQNVVFSLFFIYSFENNETIRVGAQVEIGPMGKAPAAAFVESPHSGQQVSVTRAKIVFRPQGRNRSKLGPPFGPKQIATLDYSGQPDMSSASGVHICTYVRK